jgi:hypothetical protein
VSFNGSGTFVINSSGQPVVANTVASATVFNAFTADIATGLSTCITKDGQTTPTNNIPMGGFKLTNLGAATVGTDAVRLSQLQAGTAQLLAVSGTDTLTALGTPTVTAYATGNTFYFVAAATNTTSVTLNVDGLGAKAVTRHGSTALVAGDILTGEVCLVVYDGTRFQLLNPGSYTNLNVSGNLTLNGGTTNGVAYLNGSKALTSGSALVFDGTNLGIGTATPGQRLDIVSSGATVAQIRGGSGTNQGASYFVRNSANTLSLFAVGDRATFFGGTPEQIYSIATGTSIPLTFDVGAAERMRLDSSGNLGIGTSSPGSRVSVNDPGTGQTFTNAGGGNFNIGLLAGTGSALAYVFNRANSDLLFGTNNTEVARFDASGNLMVGATSSTHRLQAEVASGADRDIFIASVAGASNGLRVQWNHASLRLHISMNNIPTSSAGLPGGTVWNDAGTLKIT